MKTILKIIVVLSSDCERDEHDDKEYANKSGNINKNCENNNIFYFFLIHSLK